MAGKIILNHLAYVIYEHPDLQRLKEFAYDFGFGIAGESDDSLYLKGYGIDQYSYIAIQAPAGKPKRFIGAGFVANSADDFARACELERVKVKNAERIPGAGQVAVLNDPNGYQMHIVWGQELRDVTMQPNSACIDINTPANGAVEKKRKGK